MSMKKNIITTRGYTYTIIYEPVEEGGYLVIVPLLQEIITYGRTLEEAREMAHDAIKCHLEALQKEKEEIPSERAFLQERLSVQV